MESHIQMHHFGILCSLDRMDCSQTMMGLICWMMRRAEHVER